MANDLTSTSSAASPSAEPASNKLVKAGVIGTAGYLLAAIVYIVVMWDAVKALDPHDFADSLSGIFAPLAFYWLVLGFFQQGQELRHSARALYLQGEELAHSVDQQRQLVAVSREQIDSELEARRLEERRADHDAQPRLVLSSDGSTTSDGRTTFRWSLKSGGPVCTAVVVTLNGTERNRADVFAEGHVLGISYRPQPGADLPHAFIDVEYTDRRGNDRQQKWTVPAVQAANNSGFGDYARPQKVMSSEDAR